ncbi:MAG: T9SS type A sorting domain-containing protein [Bacteroidota bacterium]|nr:T9SS type A sorting domain-containing protein [Bacteroidota bacterium]
MKHKLLFSICLLGALLALPPAAAQQVPAGKQSLYDQYGPNYEEVIAKFADDPVQLQEMARLHRASLQAVPFYFKGAQDDDYVVRQEMEPNDYFDTADNINDVLMTPGWRGDGEFMGGLIGASFTAGDYDVYTFTVDTTKMYYFAGTHSFPGTVNTDDDEPKVSMRLFHESDLDTTFVTDFNGLERNNQIRGDILGERTDHRANSGDFRLTGWVSPIDPATNAQLTGNFYLFLFNSETGGAPAPINPGDETGTYHFSAYTVDMEPWVSKYEPNQTFQEALTNPMSMLPPDAVVRTFMGFNPDTIKIVKPGASYSDIIPTQGNSVYPQLLAQGDEDVDHFQINGLKAGHTLVMETLPFFGYYRDTDGSIGPGNTRWSDTRCRLYDADYTTILVENDDAGREVQSTTGQPNNIHCRFTYEIQEADVGAPLWLWVSAWASATRSASQGVDNRDPGRFMYDIYVHQYPSEPTEIEPNNTVAEAMSVGTRADTVLTGAFDSASDTDHYRLFLNAQRMYTMFSTNSTVSDDIQVELFREDESDNMGGTEVTMNLLTDPVAGNAGNNDFLLASYVPPVSGAYILKLSSGSAGSYQLGLVDKGPIFQGLVSNEPDDELVEAVQRDPLEVGPGAASRTAMIWPAGDVDLHHFTVGEGFELNLSISPSQSIVNDSPFLMTLLGPTGDVLGISLEGISLSAPQAGQYVLAVNGVNETDVGFYTLAGGVPFEEVEGNDTFETANLIALGNLYDASLSSGDVDFFRFTLEAGKLYSFRSLDNETGGPLSVGFFDEINGDSLLDDSGWPTNYDGNFKIANIIPRETKTYYLSISGSPGPYKLTSRINPDYRALSKKGEPNDTKWFADNMGSYQAFGTDQMFVLSNEKHPRFFGDEDWFRVEVAAGQTVTAETKPVGGDDWNKDTDTRLVILDANGTAELDNDDDGGNEWYSLASHTATVDGHVYVVVRTSRTPDRGDDRSLNRGDYILNIDVSSKEIEPNNTPAEAAGNVLPTGLKDAEFTTDDTVDIYRLSLMADHIYHVRTIKPDGGYAGEFTAALSSAANPLVNLLSDSDTGYNTRYSGGNLKLNIIPETTGDYFLALQSDGTAGAYRLGLKGRDISLLKDKGEPNNSIAEADAMGAMLFDSPGEVNTYMLYNADFAWDPSLDHLTARWGQDLDFYRYDLVEGDTLIAESSPVDGPLWSRDYDGYMELYAADGTLIDDNDDGGFDWHSRIEFVATSDTTVFVMLRSQDHNEPGNSPRVGGTDRDPARGEYNLTVLKQDGSPILITNLESAEVPDGFVLEANYPNPFNPTTTINYALPEASNVTVTVLDLLGRRVAVLVDEHQAKGRYSVRFDASRLASGIYFYHMRAEGFVQTRKMMLIK